MPVAAVGQTPMITDGGSVSCMAQWAIDPEVAAAMAQLHEANWLITLFAYADDYPDLNQFYALTDRVKTLFAKHNTHIEGVFFCPHGPANPCDCARGKPGLFNQMHKVFKDDFHGSAVISENPLDLNGASAAGLDRRLRVTQEESFGSIVERLLR